VRTLASRHILIGDQEDELPYSKGLMASAIMATGLAPARAFHVAEVIEEQLDASGVTAISHSDLNDLAHEVLCSEVGDRYAQSFAKWQTVKGLDRPLVVVLGGATGVGKSTIATMLASRLGVTRVIPTDAIREVMRSMFTADLYPSLHTSSFDAASLVRHPLPSNVDPVIIGFREQVSAVSVGIAALVQRAVEEGTDLIIEGAHAVPGFVDLARFGHQAVVVPMVVTVDEVELHRSHFLQRSHDSRHRPAERYLESFENIRKIHRYIRSLALQHNVAIIPSYNLDATLSQVIDLVVGQAFEAVPDLPGQAGPAREQDMPNGPDMSNGPDMTPNDFNRSNSRGS
jgi:2-phosphoglycerate kinase